MIKELCSALFLSSLITHVSAQETTIDTVVTGNGYANQLWYSLENYNQASAPTSNWDLAFSTSFSQTNPLTTSILFNHKIGFLYEIPGSNPSNFETADTTGMVANGALYNSDTSWAAGAFNNTINLGSFDYGWGNYDMASHSGINANRIFVIKYANGSYKKLKISLAFATSTYTLVYSNLDNSNLETKIIDFTPYTSKNFIYYSIANQAVVDREPAAENWDLTFMQYPTAVQGAKYMVAGILHNQGVEVASVYPVSAVESFNDWSTQVFSPAINTIGYDWKNAGMGGVTIEDSTVFFVKSKVGEIWKLVMTGFISGAGAGTGEYIFSKQKLSTLHVAQPETKMWMHLFPNPTCDVATMVIDVQEKATVAVYSLAGLNVFEMDIEETGLTNIQIPVQHLANGVYHVVCTSNNFTLTQKLLVAH